MRTISVSVCRPLLVCIILAISFSTSSAQGFAWAQSIVSTGSGGNTGVEAVTTDVNNNGYFIGNITGTANFGTQSLTSVGDLDMYILKKDASGNTLWVKQVAGVSGGSSFCFGRDICLDSFGNIYIGGFFRDSFDFDPGSGTQQLYSHGGDHSFVLKLDSTGSFIWVKDMGNPTTVAAMQLLCMKLDPDANIYFGCTIGGMVIPGNVDVDPGPGIFNAFFPGPSSCDILLEKLDSAGNFIWAKQISGNDNNVALGLALDTLRNIYITGEFRGITDYDPGSGTANMTSTNSNDAFVAKYDSAGNYQWAGQISGYDEQIGNDICTDTFGNVIVTGQFEPSSTDFDPGPGVYNLNTTSLDMFVLKLRNDGSFAWANNIQPSGYARGHSIATDGLGNVYSVGDLFGPADLNPSPDEYWLWDGVYVQKLDSAGNFEWARVFAGQVAEAMTFDHANDIYVVGQIINGGDFDPGPGVFNLPGGNAGFIEKLCGTSLAISADDSTLCTGQNAQLTTPAISGATYTWTRNDTVIGGSGNSVTISTPGAYEVYVTGGCPNASAVLYVHDCTGVGETAKATDVEAYPNPFDDVIAVKGLETGDQVYLLDITGRTLRIWQSATSTESFTTTDISPGYYVLRIVNEQRAVKENVPVVKR